MQYVDFIFYACLRDHGFYDYFSFTIHLILHFFQEYQNRHWSSGQICRTPSNCTVFNFLFVFRCLYHWFDYFHVAQHRHLWDLAYVCRPIIILLIPFQIPCLRLNSTNLVNPQHCNDLLSKNPSEHGASSPVGGSLRGPANSILEFCQARALSVH